MSKADPSKDLQISAFDNRKNSGRIPVLQAVCKIKIHAVVKCSTSQNFLQLMTRMIRDIVSKIKAVGGHVLYRIWIDLPLQLVIKVISVQAIFAVIRHRVNIGYQLQEEN